MSQWTTGPRRSGAPRWVWAALLLLVSVAAAGIVLGLLRGQPRSADAQPPAADPAPAALPNVPPPRPGGDLATEPRALPAAAWPSVAATPTAATQPASSQPAATQPEAALDVRQGLKLIEDGKLVEGRAALSALLFDPQARLSAQDAQAIRDTLTSVNKELVFGRRVLAGDPLAAYHTVQAGDVLSRIVLPYKVPYQLIEQVNGVEARRLQADRKIKVLKGPFHAVVHKSEFRLDVLARVPDAADGRPVYITSFPVGLGEEDSTPPGLWVVATKVQNPGWTNPRTHEYFAPDNPRNPVGEQWLGLEGAEEVNKDRRGYGLHGTVEPQSIGRQMSMGCVRLRNEDVAQLAKLLVTRFSTVRIQP